MNDAKHILIAGGSGFIGQHLASRLTEKGYAVSLLGRNSMNTGPYNYYSWNPTEGKIDPEALKGMDVIINLTGAGIADRQWTRKRKDLIYRSRIDSTGLLVNAIIDKGHSPTLFINASAIGYYGNRPGELLTENSEPGSGFVSKVCSDWEKATTPLQKAGIPTAILRIGIVLGKHGGSLSKLVLPLKYGINVLFGKGKHFTSWIHIQDIAQIIVQLISGRLRPGVYNAASPKPLSQREFNSEILTALHRKAIKLNLPVVFLQVILGDLVAVFTADLNIQPRNLTNQKFTFNFPDIQRALADLLAKS